MAGLAVPMSGAGGLVILVSRPQAAPCPAESTPNAEIMGLFAEQFFGLGEIVTRRCGPDESEDLTEDHYYYVCETEQQ